MDHCILSENINFQGRKRPKKFHVNRDWFYQRYVKDMAPTRDIASEIGCVNDHVNALAKKFDIPIRPRLKRSVPYAKLNLNIDEIVRLYVDEKISCADIGSRFGCTHKAIATRLAERGIPLRHHNDTKRGKPAKNKIILDPKKVVKMYMVRHASGKTVADHFGVSRQVIDRILRENGVKRKPATESVDRRKERHPRWRHDISDEDRKKGRDANKQKEWRARVFERDGHTCQKCGDSRGGNLHSHHIIPHYRDQSIAWDLENGITLCETCHTNLHRTYGFLRCNRETLAEYLSPENEQTIT